MSYDLMVFDPTKAPKKKKPFMRWYAEQIKWAEDHVFEGMEEVGTDHRLTDYSFGKEVIYASFAWSVAEEAYSLMRELAKKHNVGFF
ncbi:MAG: hypothetical protein IKE29_06980 [Paenibacillus sp.]|uniref:hypothetical protein n=1 Tax=Paenibacillus sp. TaxID=58172 RepID=UPI0025DAE878|nr:hypothetical protein [Paenibacillus sp.]MBR2564349.1 hypothetical protein [Paenibacillus sp.]